MNSDISIGKLANLPFPIRLLVALATMLAVAALVAFVSVVFVTKSKDELADLKQKEQDELAHLARLQKAQIEAETYQAAIDSAEKILEEIGRKLPSGINAASFLEQLYDNAQTNGIKVISSQPFATITKDFIEEIPIEITGCATYHQLGSFVANLSQLERIITLDEFSMIKPVVYENKEFSKMTSVRPRISNSNDMSRECEQVNSLPFTAKISTYRYNVQHTQGAK